MKRQTPIYVLFLVLLIGFLYPKEVQAIPYYDNGTILEVTDLPSGPEFIRVDPTAGVYPLLGQYRVPTIYEGRIHKNALSSLNSWSVVPWAEKTGSNPSNGNALGYHGQKYYHLVNYPSRNAARNLIEPSDISESILKDVYNGNGEYAMAALNLKEVETNGSAVGSYYWIQDIALVTGGIADNAENNSSYNSTNPTWLRFVRTSWPDIKTFKFNETPGEGKATSFYIDGWEYVSQNRTRVDYKITGTYQGLPDDAPAEAVAPYAVGEEVFSFEDTVFSNKAAISKNYENLNSAYTFNEEWRNPDKKEEYETGYFRKSETGDFTAAGCGTYEFTLHIDDEVKRYDDKTMTVTIPCCVDDDGNPIPCDIPDDDDTDDPGTPSGQYGTCAIDITVTEGSSMESNPEDMEADPIGKIIEDEKTDSAIFDVLTYGIPTDENLWIGGETERYLSDFKYQQYTGKIKYTIKVDKTYNRSWTIHHACTDDEGNDCSWDSHHSDSQTVVKTFDDEYSYSYWQIGHLIVYKLDDLTFENYALPSGMVVVPNTRHDTIVDAIHSAVWEDHVFPKLCNNVTLPSSSLSGTGGPPPIPDETGLFKAAAELGSRIPDVKNDRIHITEVSRDINGSEVSREETLYMDDTVTPTDGPTPTPIPKAKKVDLEKSGNYIDKEKVNKWQTESKITSNYSPDVYFNISPKPKVSFTNNSTDNPEKINKVTVHTPVVMYAKSSDDKAHDQRTYPPIREDLSYTDGDLTVQSANADADRHAFILDRPFTVVLPTTGQHINEPGYGDRDYAKYYKDKQVRFPFDVYTETKAAFIPANTWISVPINNESVTFYMPVWVKEGEYTVDYRAIAINAPDDHVNAETPKEHEANLNQEFRTENEMMDHHVANDTIEVDVVGRLYDLKITNVLDYNWQDVFVTEENNGILSPTGNKYWVGTNEIDGATRGNVAPYVLPIRHGSHGIGYPNNFLNMAIKTGYKFQFDMKSKGNMYDQNDAIRITPTFEFVNKNGERQNVDLYYHDETNYFVKVGSDKDKTYRSVVLNEAIRFVEGNELEDNADYYYRYMYNAENLDTLPINADLKELYKKSYSKEQFITKYVKDYTKRGTETGTYAFQILNSNLRTFIGPEENEVPEGTSVEKEDIIAREQHWYGEYSLPANVYVVKKQEPQYDENGNEIPQVDTIAGYGLEKRLNDNSDIFLKDGYIVVNFNIETIDNGNVEKSHLTYHTSPMEGAPLNNQWKMEGFNYQFVDGYGKTFNLKDGDMVFYHADQSSYDDFHSNVTH